MHVKITRERCKDPEELERLKCPRIAIDAIGTRSVDE